MDVYMYSVLVHLEHIQRLHTKYIQLTVEIGFRWGNQLYKTYLDHYTILGFYAFLHSK